MRMDSDLSDRPPEFLEDPKDTVSNFIKKIHRELFAILCTLYIY